MTNDDSTPPDLDAARQAYRHQQQTQTETEERRVQSEIDGFARLMSMVADARSELTGSVLPGVFWQEEDRGSRRTRVSKRKARQPPVKHDRSFRENHLSQGRRYFEVKAWPIGVAATAKISTRSIERGGRPYCQEDLLLLTTHGEVVRTRPHAYSIPDNRKAKKAWKEVSSLYGRYAQGSSLLVSIPLGPGIRVEMTRAEVQASMPSQELDSNFGQVTLDWEPQMAMSGTFTGWGGYEVSDFADAVDKPELFKGMTSYALESSISGLVKLLEIGSRNERAV